MKSYRHGDVLIVEVAPDSIPRDRAIKRGVDPRGLVLAEGEVTGHHHRIQDASKGEILVTDAAAKEMRMWLELEVASDLVHEEHATIKLPAGAYEVIIQKEYEAGELRNVAD